MLALFTFGLLAQRSVSDHISAGRLEGSHSGSSPIPRPQSPIPA